MQFTQYAKKLHIQDYKQPAFSGPLSSTMSVSWHENSETLTPYTTVTVLKFLTSTPNPAETAERNMKNPRTKNYTSFILK